MPAVSATALLIPPPPCLPHAPLTRCLAFGPTGCAPTLGLGLAFLEGLDNLRTLLQQLLQQVQHSFEFLGCLTLTGTASGLAEQLA